MSFSRTVEKLCKLSIDEGMGKIKENMVKLKCSSCSRITHHTKRNKKKVKEKLELSKYCRFCKKNAIHTESK